MEKDKKLSFVCEGLLHEYESFMSRTEESSSKTSHLNERFEEKKLKLEKAFDTLKEKVLDLETLESHYNAESRNLNERLEKLKSRSKKLIPHLVQNLLRKLLKYFSTSETTNLRRYISNSKNISNLNIMTFLFGTRNFTLTQYKCKMFFLMKV